MAIDYAELAYAVADAMIVCDAPGATLLRTTAAARIFGRSRAGAQGRSLDIDTPVRPRERRRSANHETLRTMGAGRSAKRLPAPAAYEDGCAMSIAFTVALPKSGRAAPCAIVAAIGGETRPWTEARALRMRACELEARAG